MPRQARQVAASGIHHIVSRGMDKQQIFEDDGDNLQFLRIVQACQSDDVQILAFALMGNHYHLLVQTLSGEAKPLESFMKSLGIRYVAYYNARYQRLGTLFQGRFKSQPVETDMYFFRTLRYIHNNPVAAGICKHPAEYQWSSYPDYFCQRTDQLCSVNIAYAQTLKPLEWLKDWHKNEEKRNKDFIDIAKPNYPMSDTQAKQLILHISGCHTVSDFQSLTPVNRNAALKKLVAAKIGQRQLSRLTGISRGIIQNAVCLKD